MLFMSKQMGRNQLIAKKKKKSGCTYYVLCLHFLGHIDNISEIWRLWFLTVNEVTWGDSPIIHN